MADTKEISKVCVRNGLGEGKKNKQRRGHYSDQTRDNGGWDRGLLLVETRDIQCSEHWQLVAKPLRISYCYYLLLIINVSYHGTACMWGVG